MDEEQSQHNCGEYCDLSFESIRGDHSTSSGTTGSGRDSEDMTFNKYFEERNWNSKRKYLRALISGDYTSQEMEEMKQKTQEWYHMHQAPWEGKDSCDEGSFDACHQPLKVQFRDNGNSMSSTWRPRQSNGKCKEEYMCRRIGSGSSRIAKLLVEGSLYEGSSVTSLSDNAITFFPDDDFVEEKKESEK